MISAVELPTSAFAIVAVFPSEKFVPLLIIFNCEGRRGYLKKTLLFAQSNPLESVVEKGRQLKQQGFWRFAFV